MPSASESRRVVSVLAIAALLVVNALGLLATPRPVAAIGTCPNCAKIVVDIGGVGSGTVVDGNGNTCIGSPGTTTECTFSYVWPALQPTTDVTLTAEPDVESIACFLDSGGGCAAYGSAETQSYTLHNEQDLPTQHFGFNLANAGTVEILASGSGAGSVLDVDHPAISCSYAAGIQKGDCLHQYFWDPSIPSISLDFTVKASPGSGACLGGGCLATSPIVSLPSLPLQNGGTATVVVSFVALASTPPTARPSHAASSPAVGPSPTSEATSPQSPGPVETAAAAAESPAPEGTPAATSTGGLPPVVVGLLAVAVLLVLVAGGLLMRSRPRS